MLSSLPLEPGPQVGGSVLVMPVGGMWGGGGRRKQEDRREEGRADLKAGIMSLSRILALPHPSVLRQTFY